MRAQGADGTASDAGSDGGTFVNKIVSCVLDKGMLQYDPNAIYFVLTSSEVNINGAATCPQLLAGMFDPIHSDMLNSLVALLRSLHITMHRQSPVHSMYFSTLGLCWRFGFMCATTDMPTGVSDDIASAGQGSFSNLAPGATTLAGMLRRLPHGIT